MRPDHPTFGPGGNSESFYNEGYKSTLQAPAWLRARGLDAYEYQAGNGLTAGTETLRKIGDAAAEAGASCEIYQSNHEGAIVDKIQEAYGSFDGIVINPAAYTHTSVAIADALSGVAIPTVEVHLSDVMQRESFRHHSFVAPIAKKTYMGLGFEGYKKAIRYLVKNEE